MKEKVYLQITSGRGPAECCRVVALVLFSCAKKNKYLIKKKEEDDIRSLPERLVMTGLIIRIGKISNGLRHWCIPRSWMERIIV